MLRRSSILSLASSIGLVVSMAACSGPMNGTMDVHEGGSSTEAGDVRSDALGSDAGDARMNDGSADTGAMTDATTDLGSPVDTAVVDATDSGTVDDTGTADTGSVDTGTMDTGPVADSGSSDSGSPIDVVMNPDVGPSDTGMIIDVPTPDVPLPDVSVPDARPSDTGVPMCGPMEHLCACATGGYCLRIGFMCLNPSAPCP